MFVAVTALLVASMAITLVRVVRGPTPYDRILGVNVHGTMTVLLIAVTGYLTGRPDFLDLSIAYALLNFVGTLAALKYFRFGHLGDEP